MKGRGGRALYQGEGRELKGWREESRDGGKGREME